MPTSLHMWVPSLDSLQREYSRTCAVFYTDLLWMQIFSELVELQHHGDQVHRECTVQYACPVHKSLVVRLIFFAGWFMVSHRRVCLHNSTVTFVMLQGLGDSALFISERVGIHITAFGCCPTLISCFYFVNCSVQQAQLPQHHTTGSKGQHATEHIQSSGCSA